MQKQFNEGKVGFSTNSAGVPGHLKKKKEREGGEGEEPQLKSHILYKN